MNNLYLIHPIENSTTYPIQSRIELQTKLVVNPRNSSVIVQWHLQGTISNQPINPTLHPNVITQQKHKTHNYHLTPKLQRFTLRRGNNVWTKLRDNVQSRFGRGSTCMERWTPTCTCGWERQRCWLAQESTRLEWRIRLRWRREPAAALRLHLRQRDKDGDGWHNQTRTLRLGVWFQRMKTYMSETNARWHTTVEVARKKWGRFGLANSDVTTRMKMAWRWL